jgi:hypothetical protein
MKEKISTKSSEKLGDFLEKNNLHKKDFAQMIGVTLSYVYNLIDNTIPFSTRGTTLERISTVMEIEPEEFEEYRIPQEPILIDDTVLKIKNALKSKKEKVVDFLKKFPRGKRVDIVDVLRGAIPVPLDYNELQEICSNVNMTDEQTFDIWENRFKQTLEMNGLNLYSNSGLVNSMIECAKNYTLGNKK